MSQPRLIRKVWEVGAEQPARVGTAPSSNSSEEGWRQSRAGALKHAARVSPRPTRGLPAIPREGGKAGYQWPHAGGRTGFPPTAVGRDRRLRCCHLTRSGGKGRETWAKRGELRLLSITLGSTTAKRKLEVSQHLGTWVLPGSLWPTLGGCPALTSGWHPPVLASDLQWSSWQIDLTLQ